MKQYKIMAEGKGMGVRKIVTVHAINLSEAKKTFAKKYPFMMITKFMKLQIRRKD